VPSEQRQQIRHATVTGAGGNPAAAVLWQGTEGFEAELLTLLVGAVSSPAGRQASC